MGQENKYSPKYVVSTCENEWDHKIYHDFLSPLEAVEFHEVQLLPLQQQKTTQVYAYLEKKEKGNSPLKNVNHYAGNYVLLGFFSLSLPPVIEFPAS